MEEPTPLSKRQLKKQARNRLWEENRETRKAIRKEKIKAKRARNRAAREDATPQSSTATDGYNKRITHLGQERRNHRHPQPVQLPVALVVDCGFDDLMRDSERKSLGAQITRAYSDNNHAPYKAYLIISSFGGHLKERFDTVLAGHHRSWKGVQFLEGDFLEAASRAETQMRSTEHRTLAGALASKASVSGTLAATDEEKSGEIIYLTSDSPQTLTSLSPYSTYVVGGIVDKNRHKGICYKKAMDHGVTTAKLPIGDYMQMSTRSVLTTNHVVEIMLRWLECGDWGEAFMKVIPMRKGGLLKSNGYGRERVGDDESQPANEEEWVVESDVEVVDEPMKATADDTPQATEGAVQENEII